MSVGAAQLTPNSNVLTTRATPVAVSAITDAGNGSIAQSAGLIQSLNKEISDLNKRKILATSKEDLELINVQLKSAKDQLADLSSVGVQTTKQVEEEFLKENAILGGLVLRMKELKDARLKASDVGEIEAYNREIKALDASIKALTSAGNPKLVISSAQPIPNSNVLRSPATPQAIDSVRQIGGGITPQIQQQIGLIGKLNAQISDLNKQKILAGSEDEIKKVNKQLASTQKELDKVSNVGTKSNVFGKLGDSILQGIGIGSGIQLIGTATRKVEEFIDEAGQMAKDIEGINTAFNALNSPGLLNNLRESTKGTVSDLNLMKEAVQYSELGLPVDKLGLALQFARMRARETGQDVDYLVKSVVNGIGRQSVKILDNLGLSQVRVRNEFKKVGDFGQAAFNIISEEIKKSGADLDTYADRIDRINANIDNQKAKFGEYVNFIKEGFLAIGRDIGESLIGDDTNENLKAVLDGAKAKAKAEQEGVQSRINSNAFYNSYYKKYLDDFKFLGL